MKLIIREYMIYCICTVTSEINHLFHISHGPRGSSPHLGIRFLGSSRLDAKITRYVLHEHHDSEVYHPKDIHVIGKIVAYPQQLSPE